jgi:hypothetical protein
MDIPVPAVVGTKVLTTASNKVPANKVRGNSPVVRTKIRTVLAKDRVVPAVAIPAVRVPSDFGEQTPICSFCLRSPLHGGRGPFLLELLNKIISIH